MRAGRRDAEGGEGLAELRARGQRSRERGPSGIDGGGRGGPSAPFAHATRLFALPGSAEASGAGGRTETLGPTEPRKETGAAWLKASRAHLQEAKGGACRCLQAATAAAGEDAGLNLVSPLSGAPDGDLFPSAEGRCCRERSKSNCPQPLVRQRRQVCRYQKWIRQKWSLLRRELLPAARGGWETPRGESGVVRSSRQ